MGSTGADLLSDQQIHFDILTLQEVNSIWRSRSRRAADGIRGLAGPMGLLLRQSGSGSNIGPPPIHQQAHCIE